MQMIGEGKSSEEIAAELGIALKTRRKTTART